MADEQLETAVLLTSELVANAVRHTGSDSFEVRVVLSREGIRIAVADRERASPVLGAPGPEAAGGRGLQLVDRLSGGWGVNYDEGGGKSVWFNLRTTPGA